MLNSLAFVINKGYSANNRQKLGNLVLKNLPEILFRIFPIDENYSHVNY